MRLSDFFPLEEEEEEDDDEESGVARAKRGPRVAARSQQTRLSKSARCAVRACVRQSQKWRKILKTVFFRQNYYQNLNFAAKNLILV